MHMGSDKGGKFVSLFGPSFNFTFDRPGQAFDAVTKAEVTAWS